MSTVFRSVGIAFAAALFAQVDATTTDALAQAGSIGGVLGKTDKSASGGEEQTTNPPPSVKRALNHPSEPKPSKCPNIVGVWDSWASGLFG